MSADRFRVFRLLGAGLVAVVVASVALVASVPAHSAEVYARPWNDTLTLSGHGFGHGHGMSQWGAYGAATVGKLSWQAILAAYYPGTALANLGNQPIRVRLDAVSHATLSVPTRAGLRLGGRLLPGPANGITRYRVFSRTLGRLEVDSYSSAGPAAGWTLYAYTASPAVFSNRSGRVDVLLTNGTRRAYRGSIVANWASPTSIRPVSVLPMESYLRAVVAAEMPSSWDFKALEAQAVAARSYANYDRAHAPEGRSFDTCDTTSCQMYSGVPAETATTDAAIVATAGQTLTYLGMAAFTQFGSANGGWSAAGGQPYLAARVDPYDGAVPNSANLWGKSITVASIEARWPAIGTYRQLRIITRDGHGQWGGRVLTAAVDGSKGSVAVSGGTLREAFGLRSEWFIPINAGSATSYPRDFNGDRSADVLGVVAGTGVLRLYPGNGASGWAPMRVIATGFGGLSKVLTAGTWDADTLPDVMAQKRGGSLWLYPGTPSGALGLPRRLAGASWDIYNQVFPVGDFNGDGHSDLMARRPSGALLLYRGNGAGGFLGAARLVRTGWAKVTAVSGPGDFNGDGKPDLIARTSDGLLSLYPGNGSGGWLPARLIGQGWNRFSIIVSPGDFNGDGRADLLGRGRDGTLWMYPGDGTGRFLAPRPVGKGWNILSTVLS